MTSPLERLSQLYLLQLLDLNAPLGFALLLVAGALMGEVVARHTRLPRVTGYTVAGGLAALLGHGASVPVSGWLGGVLEWALSLLLFEIGAKLRLRWFAANPPLLLTGLLESLLSALAVYAVLTHWAGYTAAEAAAVAVICLPASAAVAGRVAMEVGADGQVTQRMTALTALSTMTAVCAMVLLKGLLDPEHTPSMGQALQSLAAQVAWSLALAAGLAAAVGVVIRRLDPRNESAVLAVLGLVLCSATLARQVGASSLLVPLLAGVLLRNTSQRAWSWPQHFGTAGSALVLVLFVLCGSAWSLTSFQAAGLTALVLVAVRLLTKLACTGLLGPWSGLGLRRSLALALTLTPLSASALLLLSDFSASFPKLATGVMPVVLCAVAMLEIAGPVLVQWALTRAGEGRHSRPARSAS
jgi:Kef-type K+ transport system membrane component KefB